MSRKLTIVGAGWAGLSAAVQATQRGFQVHLIEAAATPGGRAKSISHQGLRFDNGQHAFLGAYSATLSLIESIGLNTDQLFEREALHWSYPNGAPFGLTEDPYPLKLTRSLLKSQRFDSMEKVSLLKPAFNWLQFLIKRFASVTPRYPMDMSVEQLVEGVSKHVVQDIISPLCLSAMNTPMADASANTFLRILKDAFKDPPHSCDFLWPRMPLSDIMPERAVEWLREKGGSVQLGQRVDALSEVDPGVPCLLAVPPWQAAKLTRAKNPHWSTLANQLQHRAIASVYLKGNTDPTNSKGMSRGRLMCFNQHMELENCVHPQFGVQLQAPMALTTKSSSHADSTSDTGLQHWVLIVSVADPHKREEIIENALRVAQTELGLTDPALQFCSVEKRATFSCEPGLSRPPSFIAEGLWACGDYVQGPYPSTIEGAVMSGVMAVEQISRC